MIVQNPPVDPLSDLLAMVQARPACSIRLEAGGPWAMRFDPDGCKFNMIRQGNCWLTVGDARWKLGPGDCVVIKAHTIFTLASDPKLEPVDASMAFANDETRARVGSGSDVEILGGSVRFGIADASLLLDLLPPALVIQASADAAALIAWLLDQLDREWRNGRVGSRAACDDLLRLMFVHALRTHLTADETHAPGWITALSDPRIGAAIRAIHAEPARPWRLAELAQLAGQSRSTFAANFKALVGVTPVDYAAGWRLSLAATRLQLGRETASAIAAGLGFLSDSSFGVAFKRKFGTSPGQYRNKIMERAPAYETGPALFREMPTA